MIKNKEQRWSASERLVCKEMLDHVQCLSWFVPWCHVPCQSIMKRTSTARRMIQQLPMGHTGIANGGKGEAAVDSGACILLCVPADERKQ